jgi:DNA gyrase/topoisomerase IV subunit A
MDKLRVDPIQAKFLAGITIPQMSLGYLKKCQEAVKKYNLEIKDIMAKLLDRNKLDEIIINEMLEIKRKYNDKVLCKLITKSEALGVAPGLFKLVFTKNNFVKKMNVNDMVQPAKMANVKYVLVADNT